MVTMPQPDRYEPLPSIAELPGFLMRKLSPGGRRVVLGVGSLLLAAVVLAAILVVPQLRSDQHDKEAQVARSAQAARAELLAKYAREARPVHGAGPAAAGRAEGAALVARRRLVHGLEAAVLADARARASRGELHGRYAATTCYRFPKGVDDKPPAEDMTNQTAVVECLAVSAKVARNERTTTGSLIGQPYRAQIDFEHGRYAFCKIVQMPGELAIQRGSVLKVPAACSGKR